MPWTVESSLLYQAVRNGFIVAGALLLAVGVGDMLAGHAKLGEYRAVVALAPAARAARSGRALPEGERGAGALRGGAGEARLLPAPLPGRAAARRDRCVAAGNRRVSPALAHAPCGAVERGIPLTSGPLASTSAQIARRGDARSRGERWRRLGVAGRGAGAGRRAQRSGRGDAAMQAVVELLARGLGLERAAVLARATPLVTGSSRLPRGAASACSAWRCATIRRTDHGAPSSRSPRRGRTGRPRAAGGAGRTAARRRRTERSRAACSPGSAPCSPRSASRTTASKARELLARADRLSVLGTLAAGIAHEIRNPLVSVRTFIELLPERLHDEEFRTAFRAAQRSPRSSASAAC